MGGAMSLEALRLQQSAEGAVVGQYEGQEQVAHYGDVRREYDAARQGVAVVDRTVRGRCWLQGRDAAALLHRLSTNNIERLQAGQGLQTVITNHNGRIIDVLDVYALPDQMLVVSSPQQRAAIPALFRKNIFFNDQVQVVPADDQLGQLLLLGAESHVLLDNLIQPDAMDALPVEQVAPLSIRTAQVGDVRAWIAHTAPLEGDGYTLFTTQGDLPLLWAALIQAGAQPVGYAAYDLLRVEAGRGLWGREWSLDYIPLETGLWDAVSFDKGCYVGQEIIARMESRGRIAKKLCGVRLDAAVAAPRKLRVGGVDGNEAGDLTSVVESPRFGHIGLAYIRTKYVAVGSRVGFDGSDVQGTVVALPFTDDTV